MSTRPGFIIVLGLVVVVTLTLTYGVRGCRPETGQRDTGSTYVPPGSGDGTSTFSGSASTGRTTEEAFLNVPEVMTERLYQDTFDGVISGRLSPDGACYSVTGSYQRGARKYLGFRVYSVEGELLWEHVFADASYRSCGTWFLAGGKYIGAVATDFEGDGEVHLLDRGGRYVLSRPIKGWTVPVMSSDGSWLALVNERHRTLQVLGLPDLELAWSAGIDGGATVLFVGDGPELLVSETGRARLFEKDGQARWTINIQGGGRWSAVCSPDRQLIAATTEDPDTSVYLYNVADGSLIWSQFLVVGGDKRMTFSPDGAFLVIYDVGQHAAIYLMNVVTGEIPWRFTLKGREDASLTVKTLQFTPSGQHLLVDTTESSATEDDYVYYHNLLLMTLEGRALWVSPLGLQVDVDVSSATEVALITTNNPIDLNGDVTNTLTLVSFSLPVPTSP